MWKWHVAVFKICKSYGANVNPLNARPHACTHAVVFDVTETTRESAYNFVHERKHILMHALLYGSWRLSMGFRMNC